MPDKLTDLTPMPFGKHKGTEMANVPDEYLIWFWGENKSDYRSGMLRGDSLRVMDYIDNSFPDLD